MNDFPEPPASTVTPEELQITLPPVLHAKLQAVAALKRCSVEEFVQRVASDEADKTLFTGNTALQRALAPVQMGKPAPRRPLTRRELEVLGHLTQGRTIAEVATALGIRWFTVNDHIKSIYRKLGVNSRAAAVLMAAKMGVIA